LIKRFSAEKNISSEKDFRGKIRWIYRHLLYQAIHRGYGYSPSKTVSEVLEEIVEKDKDMKSKNQNTEAGIEAEKDKDMKSKNQNMEAGIEAESRRRFSEIYNKARYGRHELTPEEFSEMQQLMLRLQPENHLNKS
jgi:hypothetical protein